MHWFFLGLKIQEEKCIDYIKEMNAFEWFFWDGMESLVVPPLMLMWCSHDVQILVVVIVTWHLSQWAGLTNERLVQHDAFYYWREGTDNKTSTTTSKSSWQLKQQGNNNDENKLRGVEQYLLKFSKNRIASKETNEGIPM